MSLEMDGLYIDPDTQDMERGSTSEGSASTPGSSTATASTSRCAATSRTTTSARSGSRRSPSRARGGAGVRRSGAGSASAKSFGDLAHTHAGRRGGTAREPPAAPDVPADPGGARRGRGEQPEVKEAIYVHQEFNSLVGPDSVRALHAASCLSRSASVSARREAARRRPRSCTCVDESAASDAPWSPVALHSIPPARRRGPSRGCPLRARRSPSSQRGGNSGRRGPAVDAPPRNQTDRRVPRRRRAAGGGAGHTRRRSA